ncbi:MAG: hypothetical protein LKF35_01900 [Bifidobacterium minimum]|jgi:hypothetical protein|nr:hypothetical protein [Bifidobacterium minimum]
MDELFQIVTMIIPKAGIQVGNVPLTANMILLAMVLIKNPNQAILSIQRRRGLGICYGIFVVFGIITFLLGTAEGFSAFRLAQIITVLASPLAGVIALRTSPERSLKILTLALLLVNFYALLQFIIGIDQTAIPGITYTYGQDLATKTNGVGMSKLASAQKMPSTFQVGNSLGIFDALGISLILIWKPQTQSWRMARYCAIAAGFIGIVLCGSRSTIIPFALVALLLLFQRFKATVPRMRGTYIAGTSLAITAGIVYVLLFQRPIIEQFLTRNLTQTLADPTAAGRTDQWSAMAQGIAGLSTPQLVRLIFFGQGASYDLGGEGLPTFFTTFGLFGTVAFYGMLIMAIVYLWRNVRTRTVALGVFCVFFAFLVDSSFYYPPNVMMVFIIVGIAFSNVRADSDVAESPQRTN